MAKSGGGGARNGGGGYAKSWNRLLNAHLAANGGRPSSFATIEAYGALYGAPKSQQQQLYRDYQRYLKNVGNASDRYARRVT